MAGPDQAAQHSTEVLHQRKSLGQCPLKMALTGFAFAGIIGYFVLYSKKKPEASALDVAKVTAGVARPENTHPRNQIIYILNAAEDHALTNFRIIVIIVFVWFTSCHCYDSERFVFVLLLLVLVYDSEEIRQYCFFVLFLQNGFSLREIVFFFFFLNRETVLLMQNLSQHAVIIFLLQIFFYVKLYGPFLLETWVLDHQHLCG